MTGWLGCIELGWENYPSLSRRGCWQNCGISCVGVCSPGHRAGKNSAAEIHCILHCPMDWRGALEVPGPGPCSQQVKSEYTTPGTAEIWMPQHMKISKLPDYLDVLHRTPTTTSMVFPYCREQKMIYTTDLCHSNSHRWSHECQRLSCMDRPVWDAPLSRDVGTKISRCKRNIDIWEVQDI